MRKIPAGAGKEELFVGVQGVSRPLLRAATTRVLTRL